MPLSRGRGTVQDVPERSGPKGWRGVLEQRTPPKTAGRGVNPVKLLLLSVIAIFNGMWYC
jgi:hypothetical protein